MDANHKLVPSGWKTKDQAQRVHLVERRGDELYVKLQLEGTFDSDEYGKSRLCGERCQRGDRVQASAGRDGTMREAGRLPQRSGHLLNPPLEARRSRGVLSVNKLSGSSLNVPAWDTITVNDVEQRSTSVLRVKLAATKSVVLGNTLPRIRPADEISPSTAFTTFHLKLRALVSDQMVERPYTPIVFSSHSAEGEEKLELAVRVYEKGAMSQYLCGLSAGSPIEISPEWTPAEDTFQRASWKEIQTVLLLGGGSGVTPLIQVAQNVVQAKAFTGRVIFLCWNHSPDSIVALEALTRLQAENSEKIQVTHVLKIAEAAFQPARAKVMQGDSWMTVKDGVQQALQGGEVNACAAAWCGPVGFCAEVKQCVETLQVKFLQAFEG